MLYLCQSLVDIMLLVMGFMLTLRLSHPISFAVVAPEVLVSLPVIYPIVAFYNRLYSYRTMLSFWAGVRRLSLVIVLTFGIELLVLFTTKHNALVSRALFFAGVMASFALLTAARVPVVWLIRNRFLARFVRRVLVLDECPTFIPSGFTVIDATAAELSPDVNDPYMLHRFSSVVVGADRVVISCQPHRREAWSMYLRGVGCSGELLVPELHAISPVHREEDTGWVGIRVSAGPLDMRNRVLKRGLDLCLTVPSILLCAPLLLLVAIAVRLDSPGPILFRQRRMGRGNRLFDVYKFRSMRAETTDQDGHRSASRGDGRVTRVGRIIRGLSLDELPQLFNVLVGDMSLVGPRPHALGSRVGDQLFWHVDQRYWLRHAIKPGITGLAQVRGHRGATDETSDLTNRLQSDLEYVGNWTLWKDIGILFRTVAVVGHHNAY